MRNVVCIVFDSCCKFVLYRICLLCTKFSLIICFISLNVLTFFLLVFILEITLTGLLKRYYGLWHVAWTILFLGMTRFQIPKPKILGSTQHHLQMQVIWQPVLWYVIRTHGIPLSHTIWTIWIYKNWDWPFFQNPCYWNDNESKNSHFECMILIIYCFF